MSRLIYDIPVSAPSKHYSISIYDHLDAPPPFLFEPYNRVAIVTNTTLSGLWEAWLNQWNEKMPETVVIVLPDGERYKDMTTLNQVYQELLKHQLGRDGLLVAWGGGVIGDLTGFAAATFMRGIDYIQVPTTLLAMVDSSVGGKTAVNLQGAKNMMGAFYQPQAVFCGLEFLKSLPKREFNAGMMEVIKYGLILDADFYQLLWSQRTEIATLQPKILATVIARCCALKSQIVMTDEKDQGLRNILNLGHTIGHALESYTDYQYYLHGEAVALGTMAIMRYLRDCGVILETELKQFISLLEFFELPIQIPDSFDLDQITAFLLKDKKNKAREIRWVILKKIGLASWDQYVDLQHIVKILLGMQG